MGPEGSCFGWFRSRLRMKRLAQVSKQGKLKVDEAPFSVQDLGPVAMIDAFPGLLQPESAGVARRSRVRSLVKTRSKNFP